LTVNKKRIVDDYDYFWGNVWDPSDDWRCCGERVLRVQALRWLPTDSGRILDLGCGNGIALSLLMREGKVAFGCDISARALKEARRYGEVAQSDGTCLPFRSETFTTILMLDAFEHVIEKEKLLRECWRVLCKNGILILTTPLPRATAGAGDDRQPYDRPATYSEIAAMSSGLFRLRAARGTLQLKPFRGLGMLLGRIPSRLFMIFPILLHQSSEILLVLEKR
jgi:SAM-dependent methyltransferase